MDSSARFLPVTKLSYLVHLAVIKLSYFPSLQQSLILTKTAYSLNFTPPEGI
jgi:hypothetical protein